MEKQPNKIKMWKDFTNKQQLVKEGLNRLLGKHTKNGYMIISSYRGGDEKTQEENKRDFEELKKDVRRGGFSFVPVYGGFIENLGEVDEREVREPALFVPNYKVASISFYDDDNALKDLGIMLSKKYNQDAFLFIPLGDDENAYYINKDGEVDMSFSGKTINDLSQMYFIELVKTPYKTGKLGGYGKSSKRYSFTENLFVQNSPIDLNEARNRYGELFFNIK